MRVGKEDTNNTNYQETKKKENKIKKKIFFSKKFSKYKQTQEKETPIKFLCKKKNYFKIYNKEEHRKKKIEKQLISKEGRWTEEEHNLFLEGIAKYGSVWKNVKKLIKTRTSVQVRSHAQKFYLKMKTYKDNELDIDFTVNSIKSIKDMIALIKLKNYDIKSALLYLNKKCEIFKRPKIIENNNTYINNINCMPQNVINNVNKNINADINYNNNNLNNIIDNRVDNRIDFEYIKLNKNIDCNYNGNFKNNYFNNNYDDLFSNNNNYNILGNYQNTIYYNNLLHNLGNNYINVNNYNLSSQNTNILNNHNYIINPFIINNTINNENEALKCFFINNIINNRNELLNQNTFYNTNEILNQLLLVNNNINDEKNKDLTQLINNDLIQINEGLLGNKSEPKTTNDFNSYSNIQLQSPLFSPSLSNSSLLKINNNESLFDRLNKQNLFFSQDYNKYNNSNLIVEGENNSNFFNKYIDSLESKNNINNLPNAFLNNNNLQNQFLINNNQIQANMQNKSNENPLNIINAEYLNSAENDNKSNKDLLIKDTKKYKGNTD